VYASKLYGRQMVTKIEERVDSMPTDCRLSSVCMQELSNRVLSDGSSQYSAVAEYSSDEV
jgi:hypothetical protein